MTPLMAPKNMMRETAEYMGLRRDTVRNAPKIARNAKMTKKVAEIHLWARTP